MGKVTSQRRTFAVDDVTGEKTASIESYTLHKPNLTPYDLLIPNRGGRVSHRHCGGNIIRNARRKPNQQRRRIPRYRAAEFYEPYGKFYCDACGDSVGRQGTEAITRIPREKVYASCHRKTITNSTSESVQHRWHWLYEIGFEDEAEPSVPHGGRGQPNDNLPF